MAGNQNHHFLCIQQRTDADRQRIFRHLINVTVKEAGVRHAGVMGQGFNAGTGSERGSRFIKGDMTVVANAAHEQVNFTQRANFLFVLTTFCVNIGGITIQQVDIFRLNINVIEEIAIHEAVIALRMLLWQANIFIHIERHHVFKTDLARFVHINQVFVRFQWRTAGWQTQDKRFIRRRIKRIDTINNMSGGPFSHLGWCR